MNISETPPVTRSMERILSWADTALPRFRQSLRSGASEEELNSLEALIGQALPDDMRELYRIADGQRDFPGLFLGIPFYPISHVSEVWSQWVSWLDAEQPSTDEFQSSLPPNTVRPLLFSRGWIPLTDDSSGNFMGIDLDPGPAGNVGQWIIFGRDEHEKVRVASSLSALLHWIAGEMEGGHFRPAVEEDYVPDPEELARHRETGIPIGVPDPPSPDEWRWRNHGHPHDGFRAFIRSGGEIR